MKSATLRSRPVPRLYAEEQPDRERLNEFRPEAFRPVSNECGEHALLQGQSIPRRKARKPKLRLMPDLRPTDIKRDATGSGEAAVRLYLREVGQVKPLTSQQETELVDRTRNGDRKARERLIKGSLRRVTEISAEYENIGLSLLELISEGNLGLLKAVERFDPSKDGSFSAFSTWWIKQSIKRALSRHSQ
jgi:DNA-directed RNA polymerase sigma subunit (sigma70/sigma32)